MTLTVEQPEADVPRRVARRPRRRRGWLVAVLAMVGVAVLLYPSAARWINGNQQANDVTGYVGAAQTVSTAERQAMLQAARDYNADLPRGPLRDPYALGPSGEQLAVAEVSDLYFSQLAVPDTAAMARLTVPSIGVDLPIYHGTDEATLLAGAGHLFGSSLPVGGPSTHAVITAHSGLPQATMFDDLNQIAVGDRFTISVLGGTLTYEVDQILTVLPDDAAALQVTDGQDYITLVTCTPVSVNSHRLLVRGHRVETAAVAAEDSALPGNGIRPGFPWWIVAAVGGGLASAGLAIWVGRRSRRRPAQRVARG